jgi:sterol 14-demethylase
MLTHVSAPAAILVALILYCIIRPGGSKSAIPWAKSTIPILGNALEWGADPLQFLLKQKKLVGEVFRVNLLLLKVTVVVGPRVSESSVSSPLQILS